MFLDGPHQLTETTRDPDTGILTVCGAFGYVGLGIDEDAMGGPIVDLPMDGITIEFEVSSALLDATSLTLEYTIDSGEEWHTIATNVPITGNPYTWNNSINTVTEALYIRLTSNANPLLWIVSKGYETRNP